MKNTLGSDNGLALHAEGSFMVCDPESDIALAVRAGGAGGAGFVVKSGPKGLEFEGA